MGDRKGIISACVAACTLCWAAVIEATPLFAFSSERDGRKDVFVMDEAGGLRNLTRISFADYDTLGDYTRVWGGGLPAWSPDGTRIAFTFYRNTYEEQEKEIYVIEADGTGLTNLTNSPNEDWYPSWSPDGSRIVFASWRDGDAEIYVMNADGTGQENLSMSPSLESVPSWSPDGAQIAFRSDREGVPQIYLMAPDGFDVRVIPGHPESCGSPAWCPDGTRLAFSTRTDIRIVELDGTEVVRFEPGWEWPAGLAWSPDGRKLAFEVLGGTGDLELYTVSLATGAIQSLADGVGSDYGLSWFPGAVLPTAVWSSSWGAIKSLLR